MKAVGYFRQPAGQRGGNSLSRQNRGFLDYCESQGYEVAATFSEDSESEAAPAFAQLVEYLKRPEKGFVVVVAQAPAVLADDTNTAAARYLQIESLGGRVQFTSRDGDALSAVLEAWSAGQAASVGSKVRSAMHRKAVRGEVLGRPPYGYRVGARNRLDLVSEEAVVIRYIFRLYLQEGLGIRLIARRLNEEGLRTRRDRPWSMVSIRDILRNRAYLGTYQRLGVRVPGTHPALVSPDDFRKVQDRLGERRTNYSPRTVTRFLLSGLATCSHCGNRMIGVSRRQSWRRRRDGSERTASYRYYQCGSRTNQGICSYHTRRADDLDGEVRRQLAGLGPQHLSATGNDAAVQEEWDAEARHLRERLRQIDRRIGKTMEDGANSRISREKLRTQGLALAGDRLKVEEDLRGAEWRLENYTSAAERRRGRNSALERLAEHWDALPFPEKQGLLREVVDRIIVSDDSVQLVLKP